MSEEDNEEVDDTSSSCCAFCGIAEIDDIKLKDCDGCDLVKYCSDVCREDHKSAHEEDCKKRAAELSDELLFKQPESTHLGDCPICSVPLPLDNLKINMYHCCSKVICRGCAHANEIREAETRQQHHICPFCREIIAKTDEEFDKQIMKRVEANNPDAMCQQGGLQYKKGDYSGAFENLKKAAALGYAKAHYELSILYQKGKAVEEFKGKGIYHLEEAAICGHPDSRFQLGFTEWQNLNVEKAVKHWIIAATQGHDGSIKVLMKTFKGGFISKEDLSSALRAHKAAVDATKSPQRDKAEDYQRFRQEFLSK